MTSGPGGPDDPGPADDELAAGLRLLAVDVETTGLDPERDRLLAVGWVPVTAGRVELAGARRHVVAHDDPGRAVTVHGLTHDDLAGGRPLRAVLEEFDAALAGRVLLAHHAPLDVGFLEAAHRAVGLALPAVPVVDTLRLERRRWERYGERPPPGVLRLGAARAARRLPTAPSHDALSDALAAAELYLAQVAELEATAGPLTLAALRSRPRGTRWQRLWHGWGHRLGHRLHRPRLTAWWR